MIDVRNTAEETEEELNDTSEALMTALKLVCCDTAADVVEDPVIMAED